MHCDVSPSNILLDTNSGVCILNDFGLCHLNGTKLNDFVGHPVFCSHRWFDVISVPEKQMMEVDILIDYESLFISLLWYAVKSAGTGIRLPWERYAFHIQYEKLAFFKSKQLFKHFLRFVHNESCDFLEKYYNILTTTAENINKCEEIQNLIIKAYVLLTILLLWLNNYISSIVQESIEHNTSSFLRYAKKVIDICILVSGSLAYVLSKKLTFAPLYYNRNTH